MKVVFLDFDGVLNSDKYIKGSEQGGIVINPSRMFFLKEIIDETNAKIVLSTSWREHWDKNPVNCDSTGEEINRIFSEHGLCIFDKIPKLHTRREEEIKLWLEGNPDTENFVVLDDMLLAADFLTNHIVKASNYFDGLDQYDVKRAIEILNGAEGAL